MKYVAFLRGINVGGHTVKMAELVKVFAGLGFENVKTVIASGNVVFEVQNEKLKTKNNEKKLAQNIEKELQKSLGYEVSVIVRSILEVQKLVSSNPFKIISVTPQTRLYVTFLAEKPDESLQVPYKTSDGLFQILKVTDTEVWSVITITPTKNTTDLMGDLEKKFGKNVTTRNWNTVVKIAKI